MVFVFVRLISIDIQDDTENYKLTKFPSFKSILDNFSTATMEQLARCHPSFQQWEKINLNEFKNGQELLLYILEKIGLNVPSEIVAFTEIVKGLENMKKSLAEEILLQIYNLCNQMITDDEKIGPILDSINNLLQKQDVKIEEFQPISEAILEMIKFLFEAAEIYEKFAAISNVAKKLEDFIQKHHRFIFFCFQFKFLMKLFQ